MQEARPKTILTFRGASKIFAQIVSRKLGVTASELAADITRPKPSKLKTDENRIAKCQDILQKSIQITNFTYEKRDLLALGLREGFKAPEIEEALARLIKSGVLNYSDLIEGYRLT